MARSALGVLLLGAGLFLAAAPGSRAAFPGDNGRIVFRAQPDPPSLYIVPRPATHGLYVVDPDGSDVRPLRLGVWGVGWSPDFYEPAWSPDGSEIAYARFDPYRGFGINAMNADGSGGRVVMPATFGKLSEPAWSPDGSLIAFTGSGQTRGPGVWIVAADGEGARLVVDRAQQPDWSPDCSRIAFLPGPIGDPGEIRIVDVHGRERPVAAGFDPKWSPDGRHIAFWRYGAVEDGEVHVIGADGSGERLLAHGREPAWSPDGREVVYSTRKGLSVTPVDGGAARALTRAMTEYHWEADWQPQRTAPLDRTLCAAWRDPVESSTPLELSVRPRRAPVGRITRFRLRVRAPDDRGLRGVPGATVRFAGVRRSTDARGRAVAFLAFHRPGERRLTAARPGFTPASATVRIVERRRSR